MNWFGKLVDMIVKDDFFVALITLMLLISCGCIITLIVRNEKHERALRRHDVIMHGAKH